MLHLLLGRLAVADHRLLDLQRRIFSNFETTGNQAGNRRATRLTKQQRGLRIDVDKNDLDRRLIGLVTLDQFAQAGVDGSQPLRQGILAIGFDAAAANIGQPAPGFFNHTKTGHTQARVDAENADARELCRVQRRDHRAKATV